MEGPEDLRQFGAVLPPGVTLPKIVLLFPGLFQHAELVSELTRDIGMEETPSGAPTPRRRRHSFRDRLGFALHSARRLSSVTSVVRQQGDAEVIELAISKTASTTPQCPSPARRAPENRVSTSRSMPPTAIPYYSTARVGGFGGYINACPQQLRDAGLFNVLFSKYPASARMQRLAAGQIARKAVTVPIAHSHARQA